MQFEDKEVLEQLAWYQGRRDEHPNRQLATHMAEKNDPGPVKILIRHLAYPNQNVRGDIIKTLDELAAQKPDWVAPFADDIITLLTDRHNRMVWGAMSTLSSITLEKPELIFKNLSIISTVIDKGSVITRDSGCLVLCRLCSLGQPYHQTAFPLVLEMLRTCFPKQLPQYAEKSELAALNPEHATEIISILKFRFNELNGDNPQKRLERVINRLSVQFDKAE